MEKRIILSLGDLEQVRVTCQGCGVIVEKSINELPAEAEKSVCPTCGKSFEADGMKYPKATLPLVTLAAAFKALNGTPGMKVEFVLPVTEKQ